MIDEHCRHLVRRGLAEGTIYARRRKLETIDSTFGLAVVEAEQIERWLDGRNLTDKSRYDWVSHLHQFYVWAIDYGHLTSDPTVRMVRPRVRPGLPRPIATGDLVLAVEMASPMMRAWLTLAAFAGLRCVEIARLDVDCVRWEDGVIIVRGKGGKERTVPMHDLVVDALRACPMPSRGRAFRRPRGGGFPPAGVSREVSLYLDSLGIGATAHQLRHWFGSRTYAAVADLRVVQELLGHSSPTTTAVYAAFSKDEARRAVSLLDFGTSSPVSPSVLAEWS